MTYEMTYNAYEELENKLPKNRNDLILRTQDDHSSESSSDDDFELLIIKLKMYVKQESKCKNKFKKKSCQRRRKYSRRLETNQVLNLGF